MSLCITKRKNRKCQERDGIERCPSFNSHSGLDECEPYQSQPVGNIICALTEPREREHYTLTLPSPVFVAVLRI